MVGRFTRLADLSADGHFSATGASVGAVTALLLTVGH